MRKLALVITLLAPFIAGCESDFDKCFSAERLKLESAHEAELAEDPVLPAMSAIEALDEKRAKAYLLESNLLYMESPEGKANQACLDTEEKWWESCTKESAALDIAIESRLRKLNLLDVSEAFGRFYDTAFGDLYEDGTPASQARKQVDAWEKGLNLDPDSLSPSEVAEFDLAYYKRYAKAWAEASRPAADFSEVAREICNVRGLYE